MIDLEDGAGLEAGDPSGVLVTLAGAAAQVREATTACAEAGMERLAAVGRPRSVLLLDDGGPAGGSGGPAALAAAAVGERSAVPVITAALSDRLPVWVGAADAVLAATTDGGSAQAQTLQEAVRRGAAVAVVAPDGSPLAERVERDPAVALVRIPAARCHPAALWSLLTPLVVGAVTVGLPGPVPGELEETALRLEAVALACRSGSEVFVNPAKELALALAERIGLVWGTSVVTRGAAARMAGAISGWAATPALSGALGVGQRLLSGPMGGHPGGRDLFADPFLDDPDAAAPPGLHLIVLRDDADAELAETAERCAALIAAAEDRGVRVATLLAEGASRLERLASLVALGDWTAAYLALLVGLDPAG